MNTFIRLFRDLATDSGGGLGALNPIGIGLGAIQTGIGIFEKIADKAKQKRLLRQRKAYSTPQEIYDILNATENRAQQGFDPATLSYLTNQTDQAFSSSLETSQRLGADPNALSAIFGQKIDSIMKIGSENHQQNLANFSAYLNALDSVAANKAAEAKSKEDILKDNLQAVGANLTADTQNISGGINTILGTMAANKQSKLFSTPYQMVGPGE